MLSSKFFLKSDWKKNIYSLEFQFDTQIVSLFSGTYLVKIWPQDLKSGNTHFNRHEDIFQYICSLGSNEFPLKHYEFHNCLHSSTYHVAYYTYLVHNKKAAVNIIG